MEMLEDHGFNLMDSDLNISYINKDNNNSNSTAFWDESYVTTVYPLLTISSGSVTKNASVVRSKSAGGVFESDLIIPLYVVIFVLAIVGNSLVLITLAQNKRMRTVTNVYLLNLVSFFCYLTKLHSLFLYEGGQGEKVST